MVRIALVVRAACAHLCTGWLIGSNLWMIPNLAFSVRVKTTSARLNASLCLFTCVLPRRVLRCCRIAGLFCFRWSSFFSSFLHHCKKNPALARQSATLVPPSRVRRFSRENSEPFVKSLNNQHGFPSILQLLARRSPFVHSIALARPKNAMSVSR